MSLYQLTVHELHEKLKEREITAVELTESIYARIDAVEPSVNGYLTLTKALALEQASKADVGFQNGNEMPPLAGIPIAIKDVICTKDVRTTCASKILSNFVPPYDATVMTKLQRQGAVMVGKTNMDEFAMGSSTENSAYQITHNPWDLDTIPGGSSGGSAAVVAADSAICSLGSDTGGSIRQPAALCGVVGMKPTYGRVSRYGLIAFASSLDQIGPFTKDVTDCALVLNAICGKDQLDSTSVDVPVPDFTKSLIDDVQGLRIGVPKEYFAEGLDAEVAELVHSAIQKLEQLGASLVDISLPHTDFAIATYYIIAPAEASANLARYDGVRYGYRTEEPVDLMDMYKKTRTEGFGQEVKRRIMLGTFALSAGYQDAYYRKAQKVRTLIKSDFDAAFEKVDVIATPTSPTPAFRIGERTADPLQMYLCDVMTTPASHAGLPGISVPCGFVKSGLPVGLQLLTPPFDEETLLQTAYTYQQHTDHHLKKPEIAQTEGEI
ncbi:Asp-tRNA(Asn)/Glu-tRNA(Gln) amidotransferase subunit GatA [Candidatus Poribacteria bacterium]|nr:Asp-tRNA(Asn)/Glu-tRNA(Gln) amidotransferase subunit GatA [Candidatus Poribacteria bacterium]MYF55780.1 Asp-tRNA(Asn)/Glu-tRNA(Gln) amidotransferase subunit GatA [Candidatus Poribacteria bacterium]MYI94584.1 Asp-tRNA(Asn)/Glu-tRNA(Gln) amidotransferase subunit GatA [Candidatus Poribacteria bacterium]